MTAQTRNDRRRQQTRGKLLAGARQAIAAKGVEETNIRDITDAADVAAGSFYTYFDTKEAIVVAAVEDVLIGFTELIEESNAQIDDPAERVASAMSALMHMAVFDPVMSQFLLRAELFNGSIGTTSRQRFIRDLEDGVACGSFNVPSINTASHLITGAMFGYLRGRMVEQVEAHEEVNTILMLLRTLGVSEDKAIELSQRYGSLQ